MNIKIFSSNNKFRINNYTIPKTNIKINNNIKTNINNLNNNNNIINNNKILTIIKIINSKVGLQVIINKFLNLIIYKDMIISYSIMINKMFILMLEILKIKKVSIITI